MSDLRKNMQVKQPNLEYTPENNGWPTDEPLTDPSSPLGRKVTVGRNGESMQGQVTTSQMRESGHHKPEGAREDGATQPTGQLKSERAPSPFQTSGYVSDPGGDTKPTSTNPPYHQDAIGRANSYPTITTQQYDNAHKTPEGK